ncbi:FAD-dependent monooxygenase, partial [Streptomyces sp. NPDC001193]
WFRLPRHEDDPSGLVGGLGERFFSALIDRGDYWQIAGLIPKGTDAERRAEGLDRFMTQFTDAVPWLADRSHAVTSWDEVKLLDVRLDRLRRWHRPGLLCIGDAAHAMSPVFGIGINLAVQDAVAAARHLVGPLREGTVGLHDVRRVQLRRMPTTVATQGMQRLAHAQVIEPLLAGRAPFGHPRRAKWLTELVTDSRWLNRVPAYFIAYGALRERPPAQSLRGDAAVREVS